MNLTIENIRGFVGRHTLNVKPITLLIGENSSGKTTLLGALSAALQPDFPGSDIFNKSPFELGSFDTIATYRGGKYGRAYSFSLGWDNGPNRNNSVLAKFVSHHGVPRLQDVEIRNGANVLKGFVNTGDWEVSAVSRGGKPVNSKFHIEPGEAKTFSLFELPRVLLNASGTRSGADATKPKKGLNALNEVFEAVYELTTSASRIRPRSTALAPLRTRPHRTYDELIEEFKPEGDHVPLVLARILSGAATSDSSVISALDAFGKASGLYKNLKVKRMGRQPSDPFQLRVKSEGPDANLVDVGYGVSQALPIIVDSILAPRGRIVLVQQPEVHLHPKAQAALGTFFCELVRGTDKRFVIETHSDYLVDRVRMAVADGVISHEDVNIAFLDRNKLDVTIHELKLDKKGNIINAPLNYRNFLWKKKLAYFSGVSDVNDY